MNQNTDNSITHEEARKRSVEKVQQVQSLMKTLHLTAYPRKKITEDGFVEDMIYWLDDEKYNIKEPEPVKETSTPDEQANVPENNDKKDA